MWCQERQLAIGAKAACVRCNFEPSDAKRDFDAPLVKCARLRLHLAKAFEIADGGLDLGYRMQRPVQPPPLPLDLALQCQQFPQRIRKVATRFHRAPRKYVPFLF